MRKFVRAVLDSLGGILVVVLILVSQLSVWVILFGGE